MPTIPRALELARRKRRQGEDIRPHELWSAADGDQELYGHAMMEAGAVLVHDPAHAPEQRCERGLDHFSKVMKCQVKAHWRPYDKCPVCGEDLT